MTTIWRNNDPPDPGDFPCDVCGLFPDDDCVCPECPVCGAYGDPACYLDNELYRHPLVLLYRPHPTGHHGLVRSLAQVGLRAEMDACIAEDNRRENAYYDELYGREGL